MQPCVLISPSAVAARPQSLGQLLYPCPVIVHVSPAPHCPASAVVRPPCPGCCWSPPPTDCTYHRPKVRAPDCRRLWCHCAVLYRVIFFNWSPLNFLCSKSLYNLQHLYKLGLVGMGSCTYKNWMGLV